MTSWLLALALAAAAEPGAGRWLVSIGVHEGTEAQDRLRHATADAQRVADVLGDLGRIPAHQILLLEDPTADELRGQLVELAAQLESARADGTLPEVIVYYSGHSDERGLTPWGQLLSWSELRGLVAALPAELRIVVLDSCASGAFVRDKGGTAVPGFLPAERGNAVEGDAFLTSASADESAQESDRLGGSFFTHHLVAGLRGAADADADRRVTLDEAYDYAYRQTVSVTERSWAGAQHPTYAMDLTGRGDVVLTDLTERSAVLQLDEALDGDVSIRDRDGLLVAEIRKLAGQPVAVAVEPGRYTLRLHQSTGGYKARVTVESSAPADVTAAMLDPISLERTRLRGPSDDLWTRSHPLGFHLVPGVGTTTPHDDIRLTGLSFDVLGVVHPELVGVELGTASWVRGDLDGFAGTGLFSVVQGRARGVQLGAVTTARQLAGVHFGGFSRVGTDTDGLQLGLLTWTGGRLHGTQWGALNLVDGRAPEGSRGVQVNGLYGRISGLFRGLQLGLVNDAERLHGLQLGVFNATGRLRGLQIGLINIVTEDSSGGETLGLINAVKDGYHAVELATDALSPLSLRIKTGSRHLYSVIRLGWDPTAHGGTGWSMGGGLGGHTQIGRFVFDADYTVMMDERPIAEAFTSWPAALFMEWQLTPGVQLSDAFAVFAGGALGLATTVDDSAAADTLVGDVFTPMGSAGSGRVARWYGSYHAGLRISF